MKLVIAIVQDENAPKLIKSLTAKEYRTTKLSSTGGFLKSGNTTLLIGVEDDKMDEVVDIIKAECKYKKIDNGKEEVDVCGANIFILDAEDYRKI
ncbi:cyclic-di-AMP receptor [Tepidimicrobium xylanilyticum]|uniref:Uncharacterized protein YaaQ n=1 Tax=Tepidimicrobium xylanilyticum TaxID=1123352 RepID=A0A1H2WMZ0_9FIRM|nr:cyclic-di-AMP receptor [Tepidimicrobium xylanilyticum]GMG95209.1 hypothetical protein EN5CB1_00350 [Tepidimicrobium xylanilyticum]SDW81359.1 Uncharacterized protein YaaQ [Tepidimicrobium xylanilyticum]